MGGEKGRNEEIEVVSRGVLYVHRAENRGEHGIGLSKWNINCSFFWAFTKSKDID